MSFRNLTEPVAPTTCLGDSLVTFNTNFTKLDNKLGNLPTLNSNSDTKINFSVTEQDDFSLTINTRNHFTKYYHPVDAESCSLGVMLSSWVTVPNIDSRWYFDASGYNVGGSTIGSGVGMAYRVKSLVLPAQEPVWNTPLEEGAKHSNFNDPLWNLNPLLNPLIAGGSYFWSGNYFTFSSFALAKKNPTITLYWTASGSVDKVLYATNADAVLVDPRLMEVPDYPPLKFEGKYPGNFAVTQPNGPIHAVCQSVDDPDVIYIGGSFTRVFGHTVDYLTPLSLDDQSKFYAIRLNSGDYWPRTELDAPNDNYFTVNGDIIRNQNEGSGFAGTLEEHPFKGLGPGFGADGAISTILDTPEFLIVGGSYSNIGRGRGLTILQKETKKIIPFYFNGEVKGLHLTTDALYVTGKFNFANYGDVSASFNSGLRVYTNGIVKIDISILLTFPNSCINREFAANVVNLFNNVSATVNAVTSRQSTIYIGGSFEVVSGTMVIAKNLACIDDKGKINVSWDPIVDGEVLTLKLDQTSTQGYLYVGGDFQYFITAREYYNKPRKGIIYTTAEESINFAPIDQQYAISDSQGINDLYGINFLSNAGQSTTSTVTLVDPAEPPLIDDKTQVHYAMCFDISKPNQPLFQTVWRPIFNGPVNNFLFHDSAVGSYVYCLGEFTNVNGRGAGYMAVLDKSYLNTKKAIYRGWRVHIQKPFPRFSNSALMWNNTIILGGNFRRINNVKRMYLARLARYTEWLEINDPGNVVFKAGATNTSIGSLVGIDSSGNDADNLTYSTETYVKDVPLPLSQLNQTILVVDPYDIKGFGVGDLLYFYIKRVGGTFKGDVYVLGWKVDFN
jgi:hypothetical protein